jgi:chemotaxis protein histidine kinase CheA
MDFRELTNQEATGLIERLNAAAAAHAEHVREQAHAEAQKTIDAIRHDLHEQTSQKEHLESSLNELRSQADALRADLRAATTDADKAKADAAKAWEAKQHADAETQKADAEAEKAETARERAEAALRKAEAAREQAETSLRKAEAAREQAETAREKADTARQQADATRKQAELAAQKDAQAKTAAESELQKVRSSVEKLRAELTTNERVRRDLELKLDTELTSSKTLRQKVADAEDETERVRADSELAMQALATSAAKKPLDRLLATFEHLTKATTTTEVLTTVGDALAKEFSRVAVFSVSANHLEGMHQVGFDFKRDISKVVIPMTMDSLLTGAVTSGRVQGFFGSELTDSSCAPFGGTPGFVLTLPISVRGETLAVIYADNSEQRDSAVAADRGVKFAELLLWHAVPMLTKLTAELQAVAEVRSYTTSLLNEIECMYDADVAASMHADEIASRLKNNVECARRLYAQRIEAEELSFPTSLIEEQLAALAATKSGTAFGRELANVDRRAEAVPGRSSRRRAAEAS